MAQSSFNIDTIKSSEFYTSATAHGLHTVDVYQLTRTPSALWIMYVFLLSLPAHRPLTRRASFIHGGAWRDPKVTSAAGAPLISSLLTATPAMSVNAASVNYRLSSHPEAPQNTAKHPEHLEDVMAALQYLRDVHGMRDFVLIGHSAGATLVFQVLAELQKKKQGLRLPKALYGIEGIYDLKALVQEYPDYRGFVEGAFGEDEQEWQKPLELGCYTGLVVLAHSDEDELLSWRQTEEMKERCEKSIGVGGGLRIVKVAGQHDEVLETVRLAAVVERYLRELL
jgi:kynurenine formamidase